MDTVVNTVREQLRLVATNVMRIAGIQGVFGDPCGVEIIPVSLDEAVHTARAEILLIDAGSIAPLFEVLGVFRAHCPRTRLIVIGQDADETYIECVIAAGVRGFVSGGANADEFAVALENVRAGSIWAPRTVLSRLVRKQVGGVSGASNPGGAVFTGREREIIASLINGQSNRDIGSKLGIGSSTVKGHLGRIMRKAGVQNRIELTMYALHRQESEPGEESVRPGRLSKRSPVAPIVLKTHTVQALTRS